MKRATVLLLMTLLAACATEPPAAPQAPQVQHYTPAPTARFTAGAPIEGGQAQQFVDGADIPAQWWALFQSPELDRLVRRALDNSPGLAQAQARLRQAEEQLSARSGATQYPKLDAKLSAYRADLSQQVPGLPLKTPLNLYLASVAVSYKLDLFGATRQELRSLQAALAYQGYELQAARLALAGNVVTAAIRIAATREQIAHTEEIIAIKTRQLAIHERLEQIGSTARKDVLARRQDLAQARAALPPLQATLEQLGHRLAVLCGQTPDSMPAPPLRLADLHLPQQLPLSLPSELARRRPDIRAAQALLDEAGAQLGVATANLYPQITLSANLGQLASSGQLFAGGAGFALLGASVAQPLFHGGELQARRRQAQAAWEQAGAAWQEVVLQGLQNVADVLRALQADADKLKERAEAAQQAQRQLEIANARLASGGISQLNLLDARQQWHSALLEQSQALADRYADSAALLQALGGGW